MPPLPHTLPIRRVLAWGLASVADRIRPADDSEQLDEPSALGRAIAGTACGYVGAQETSRNRGPVVDEIIRLGGGDPRARHPWCARFVSACVVRAGQMTGVTPNLPATGGAAKLWRAAGERDLVRLVPRGLLARGEVLPPGIRVLEKGERLRAGDIFVMCRPGRRDARTIRAGHLRQGHTGIVNTHDGGPVVRTVEGNTSPRGSATGDGVYQLTRRLDMRELVGFIRVG